MSVAGGHDGSPHDDLMVLFDHAHDRSCFRSGTCSASSDTQNPFVQKSNEHWLREGYSVSTIVEEKVIGIVSEQLGVPKEEVKLESSIIEDLKADSLDVVELVMELEDEFDITIPDDDYEKLKTVGDAIKYIDEKK